MRREFLLRIHRWLGLWATLFLVILSITGILLNYTEALKLDSTYVRNGFILKLYGMNPANQGAVYQSPQNPKDTIAYVADSLFFNGAFIGKTSTPIAHLRLEDFNVLFTENEIYLISLENQLIESIKENTLPYSKLKSIARINPEGAESKTVLIAEEGHFIADAYWLTFKPFMNKEAIEGSSEALLGHPKSDPTYIRSLMNDFQGDGVPLYRVLLDLHSGKLFSVPGQTIMNLSAISILVLIVSGLMSWRKRKRRVCENFERCKENAS